MPRARIVALAVSVGALGSLATAPASFAAVASKGPAIGQNCQPDGHISGAGSTFQTNAFNNALTYGYQQDVCGPVTPANNLNSAWGTTDPSAYTATVGGASKSVQGMVAYNYSLNGNAAKSGSGAGINRISCRTDMFAGTDLPYDSTQLTNIDGAPGQASGGTAPSYNCSTAITNLSTVPPPFGPQTPGGYPNTADATANVMSFPVAGGAVALATNLNGMCTAGTPAGLNITAQELDKIWQGTINQWNDPALVATNPILSTDNCSGPITRIARPDGSGTTAITMFTLNGIDSGTLCQHGVNSTWLSIATSSNNSGQWPSGCVDGSSNVSNPVETAASGGSPNLITLVENNTKPVYNSGTGTYTTPGGAGSIGYAELGLWGTTLPAGVSFINIEDAADTTTYGLANNTPPASVFQSPGSAGSASKCVIGVPGLPGSGTPNEAVGLGINNWANDQPAASNKTDIAFAGSGYPACGLTFDFVYTGMKNETGEVAGSAGTPGCTGGSVVTGSCQTVAGPMIGTTNDQLRTLYSFFTYVFSPLGQSNLDQATYDELPAAWLPQLTKGYQSNF